jgi:hypothetical protein
LIHWFDFKYFIKSKSNSYVITNLFYCAGSGGVWRVWLCVVELVVCGGGERGAKVGEGGLESEGDPFGKLGEKKRAERGRDFFLESLV